MTGIILFVSTALGFGMTMGMLMDGWRSLWNLCYSIVRSV